MPTRRIFVMTILVVILAVPARATVHHWGRKQLATSEPGSYRHGLGEVLVTIT
jgi:hypothetical protein